VVARSAAFVDNLAVSSGPTLSRRTWLLAAGTLALVAGLPACRTPAPTQLPPGGPEPARPLQERGARNLLALAELSAALRWLHPSDGVARASWPTILLDGIRSLESAGDAEQLTAGLRALFGELAPTLTLWRARVDAEEALDEVACPDPDAPLESRARAPEDSLTHGKGQSPSRRKGPPARTSKAAAPDDVDETGTGETGEAKPDAAKPDDTESDAAKPDDTEPEAAKPEPKPDAVKPDAVKPEPEAAKPEPKPEAAKPEPEPRPDTPAALLRETAAILQWRRHGLPGEHDDPLTCARRVVRAPDRCNEPTSSRRHPASPCEACDDTFELLAPAAPLVLELPRGLSAAIPLALWHEGGELQPPRRFGEDDSLAFSLDDRATRLLVIIEAWSHARWFTPRAQLDAHALRKALCAAAQAEASELPAILDALLASFAAPHTRRITPEHARVRAPAALHWLAERVVVQPACDHEDELSPLAPGDVLVTIAGTPIEDVLAEALPRSSGATASARIASVVEHLLERERVRRGSAMRVEVLRDETRVGVELDAWLDAREPLLGDRRPHDSITALADGIWYVDLARIPRVGLAARWLRDASAVIVDLRGPMLDSEGSLARYWLAESDTLDLLDEQILAGPDARGQLEPRTIASHRLVGVKPRKRLRCPIAVLADARTQGAAERELVAFDRLGATSIGSASAGAIGQATRHWLPGGLQLSLGVTTMLRHDGTRLADTGVAPTLACTPSWPAARERDELLERALLELERARRG
jgi:hypothetical protein